MARKTRQPRQELKCVSYVDFTDHETGEIIKTVSFDSLTAEKRAEVVAHCMTNMGHTLSGYYSRHVDEYIKTFGGDDT